MAIWIALLRGVNVGGKNRLPMKDLSQKLESIGLIDIQTYIQSGNAVFRSNEKSATKLAIKITKAIKCGFGYDIPTIVLGKSELVRAVAQNPFRRAENENDGRALHVFFLATKPKNIDPKALDAAKDRSASWHLDTKVFYLHAPDGFHNSKLAAKAERMLGVPATARNWRTVSKLVELSNAMK